MEIHTIDHHFRGQPHCIASFLIESGGEVALIETGASSSLETALEGIRAHGVDPDAIKKVLVTHVHLDHAGAAGWWASRGAQVFVHPSGAKHLIDPSKLIEGARLVYGGALDSLWGEVLPIPAGQVTALEDGGVVKVGDLVIEAWDTPGHAFHHHAFVCDGVCFAGDVAGVRLPGETFISPTTAPSQFHPESYLKSIRRLREANFDRLMLTHFGSVEDAGEHLTRYEEIVIEVAALLEKPMRAGASREEMIAIFEAWNESRAEADGIGPEMLARYETANPADMCTDGVALYWKKQLASA